ncbi:MAG: HD domain-containing protein [Firmicutes bacterium]|nr:HD domain-containing protein [Bacillota bacterium]
MFFNFNKQEKVKILENNLNILKNNLKYETAILTIFNHGNKNVEIICGSDNDSNRLNKIENEILINLEKKIKNLDNENIKSLYEFNDDACFIDSMKTEICIPLYLGNDENERIIGGIYLSSTKNKTKDLDNLDLTNKISNDLNMIYIESKFKSIFNIIVGLLTKIAEENKTYDESHPYNVAYFSVLIAKELNLSEKEISNIQIASMLHDVGKIFINNNILNKNTPYNDKEFEYIKGHSIYSYNVVNELTSLLDNNINIEDIVKYHHENYDGTGYPEGIKKEDIPLESRIIRVADSIDAMVSKRVYKETKSFIDSIIDLKRNKETLYDPKVVNASVNVLKRLSGNKNIEIINNFGMSANLNIILADEIISLKGAFRKEKDKYVFISYKENIENLLKDKALTEIEIYMDINHTIYEYKTKLDKISGNSVLFKEIKLNNYNDTFGLLWDLNGIIVRDRKNTYNVQIKYLSGDFLQFHTNNKKLENIKDFKLIIIIFEDGSKVIVPGRITKYYDTFNNHHYTFKYIGLNESTRDTIFNELFAKQRNSIHTMPMSLNKNLD